MKFFGKNSLSSVLYWVSTVCLIGFIVGLLFVSISFMTNNYSIRGANEFLIAVPYTSTVIKGDFSLSIVAAIIAFMMFYALFFFLLKVIFKAFSRDEYLFTERTIRYIRGFALINIIFPPLAVIAGYMIKNGVDFETVMQNGLHVLLGIFSLFVVAVFNKGNTLQEDINLTI